MSRKVKVYIACPYSKGDVGENVSNSIHYTEQLSLLGFSPYNPLFTHFWHNVYPHDYEFWMEHDKEWLMSCDALFRVGGESAGADREMKQADEWGIPVFTSLVDLMNWFRYSNIEPDI